MLTVYAVTMVTARQHMSAILFFAVDKNSLVLCALFSKRIH